MYFVHSFYFSWVLRKANKTAHELGRWSLCNRVFGFFGSNTAPPVVVNVLLEDALSVS